jgi:transposase-like protein
MTLEQFSCPYLHCTDYGKKNQGNITLYTRYGKKQVRLLQCQTCGKTFSELKGTLFWDSRLDWDTIERAFRSLIIDELGIRAAARANSLSKNTIKRYMFLAGKNRQNFREIWEFLRDRGIFSKPQPLYHLLAKMDRTKASNHYLHHTIELTWVEAGCPHGSIHAHHHER